MMKMRCVRCGFCCFVPWRLIVVDPEKGIEVSNWTQELNGGRCSHLLGDQPGMLSCAVHDRDWYCHTPCEKHVPAVDEWGVCRRGQEMLQFFWRSGKQVWKYEDYVEAARELGFTSCICSSRLADS